MTDFKREERYIVVKLKDISPGTEQFLREWLAARNLPQRQYVVVESDWPEYERVWQMIEQRVAGPLAAHSTHDMAPNASLGGDLCAKCGAARGMSRAIAPCKFAGGN